MPTLPTPYPFDPTGQAASNLVSGEQKVITAVNGQDYHFIVPTFGPFFADSLTLSFKALDNSVRLLQEGVDYYPTHWFISASRACAKAIYGSISLLDLNLAGVITLSYRTLGGEWTVDTNVITAILADALHNPRTTAWEEVTEYPATFPVIDHAWNLADMVGMADVLPKLTAIEEAILTANSEGLTAHKAATNPHNITPHLIGTYTSAEIDQKTNSVGTGLSTSDAAIMIQQAITEHEGKSDPHPVYQTTAEVQVQLANSTVSVAAVRKPAVLTPSAEQIMSSTSFSIVGAGYYSLYGINQGAAQFQISTAVDFSAGIVFDTVTGAGQQCNVPAGALNTGSFYYVRLRYQDIEGVWSQWSEGNRFKTGVPQAVAPTLTAPATGATNVTLTPTLVASAFAGVTGGDVYQTTEWQITTGANGAGTVAFSVQSNSAPTNQYTVPAGALTNNVTYYARVRYVSSVAGTSPWSADVSFTTAAATQAGTDIPAPGNPFGGGYMAGFMFENGQRYALVLSPRSSGWIEPSQYPFTTRGQAGLMSALSTYDGKANTDAMVNFSASLYPAAARAKALTIGGFSDWFIPAVDELETLYRNLKPTSDNNFVGTNGTPWANGKNDNSDPIGAAYTAPLPGQVALSVFKDEAKSANVIGSEALSVGPSNPGQGRILLSSTFVDASHAAVWAQSMKTNGLPGNANVSGAQGSYNVASADGGLSGIRVVRKVAAPLSKGDSFGGGLFVGYIKPGDGFIYGVVMATRTLGLVDLATASAGQVFTSTNTMPANASSVADGLSNTRAMGNVANAFSIYPFAYNLTNGFVEINGYTDWYIPSVAELNAMYWAFKPSAAANVASGVAPLGLEGGGNTYMSPAALAAYTSGVPAQNANAKFQYNPANGTFGSEMITVPSKLLLSSTWNANGQVWAMNPGTVVGATPAGAIDPTAPMGNNLLAIHVVRRFRVGTV